MAGSSCGATCRRQQKQCAADAEKCPPSGRASFEQLAIVKRNDFHKRLCTGRFPVFGGAPEVSSDGSNKPSPMAWSARGSRRATQNHIFLLGHLRKRRLEHHTFLRGFSKKPKMSTPRPRKLSFPSRIPKKTEKKQRSQADAPSPSEDARCGGHLSAIFVFFGLFGNPRRK